MALFVLTAFWAIAFPMMKLTVSTYDPNLAVFLRFGMATLLLAPWAWRHLKNLPTALAGIALGLINQGLFTLMAVALTEISSARCAFLMSTSVVQVRLINVLLGRERLSMPFWVGLGATAAGLFMLNCDDPLTRGDVLTIGAALLFAMSILLIDKITVVSGQEGRAVEPTALVFYQIATTAVIALPLAWSAYDGVPAWSWRAFLALGYCAVFATVLAHNLQMRYQKHVSTSLAAMLYALEPVLVTVFSTVWFDEPMSYETCVGGACLFAGAFVPHLLTMLTRQPLGAALTDVTGPRPA